jgi:hypothetical protein
MVDMEVMLLDINYRVVNKFRTLYDVTLEEAEEIAVETNRWLWLNASLQEARDSKILGIPRLLAIHVGMVVIDEYWHTFILHTRDYTAHCEKYFGFYIHHTPSSLDFVQLTVDETERQLAYIWELAGEETIDKWYSEYPVKYSAEALTKFQKPRRYGEPCEALV